MQSSRVGVITIAWTSGLSGSRYCSSGRPKAAVLPVPGLADHVVAGKQLGDRLRLDRRRVLVAELLERLLDRRREAEVLEGDGGRVVGRGSVAVGVGYRLGGVGRLRISHSSLLRSREWRPAQREGSRRSLPVVWRDSRALWALAASESE